MIGQSWPWGSQIVKKQQHLQQKNPTYFHLLLMKEQQERVVRVNIWVSLKSSCRKYLQVGGVLTLFLVKKEHLK